MIEEEKGLGEAAETRIEAFKGELKEANIELEKRDNAINEARAKIRTAVADYKRSTAYENYVKSKRQK